MLLLTRSLCLQWIGSDVLNIRFKVMSFDFIMCDVIKAHHPSPLRWHLPTTSLAFLVGVLGSRLRFGFGTRNFFVTSFSIPNAKLSIKPPVLLAVALTLVS